MLIAALGSFFSAVMSFHFSLPHQVSVIFPNYPKLLSTPKLLAVSESDPSNTFAISATPATVVYQLFSAQQKTT